MNLVILANSVIKSRKARRSSETIVVYQVPRILNSKMKEILPVTVGVSLSYYLAVFCYTDPEKEELDENVTIS